MLLGAARADAARGLRRHARGDRRARPTTGDQRRRRPRRQSGSACPARSRPRPGLVKNANSTWLIGRALHADLERRLGRQVRLANDANCLAMSEAADGAAAGAEVVFAVILGTGVGGGLAVRGGCIDRGQRDRRRVGTQPAAVAALRTNCRGRRAIAARRGCIETCLSGPGLAADYARRGGARLSGRRRRRLRAVTATRTRPSSLDAWLRSASRSRLRPSSTFVDPDVIVAGGGLSRIAAFYDRVPQLWTRWVFSDRVDTRLRRRAARRRQRGARRRPALDAIHATTASGPADL